MITQGNLSHRGAAAFLDQLAILPNERFLDPVDISLTRNTHSHYAD